MPQLPEDVDPYNGESPYDILGVKPSATAKEIKNTYARTKRDIQESGLTPSERAQKLQIIEEAYNQLRVAANRVQVDFFTVDNEIGHRQCRAVAEAFQKPDTDVGDLIKPKRIRVSHQALVDSIADLEREPERVVGLHALPIQADQRLAIPEPLAVQFDC